MPELFAAAEEPVDDANQGGLWAEPVAPELAPSYRVLARKYRPRTFEQLIGQEAMVRTLSNAIEAGRLPHAWMLTGVRGIGKTTTARIIARALNCTGADGKGGPTLHPCGVCDACKAIAEDRHVDVLEMDAASRTSVEDIREIIDGVRYGPASARYKIYILDEVHMLSKNAFNALLKTLEEPPPHTKFIFATTEIRKVPVTVLSRCQRFDLRRIDAAMLTKHFTDVVGWEDVKAEPEGIKLIAHAADGSVRDGLSLLDQAIARGNGAVTEADVKDMLGLADRGTSITLCRQILRGEVPSALTTYMSLLQAGADPLQILQDMAELIHLLTRAQVITDYAADQTLPEYDRKLMSEMGDVKIPALTRAWQILLKGIAEVQHAPHPSQAAEMVLIRLAYAADLPLPGDLIKQIRDNTAASAAVTSSGTTSTPPSPPRGRSGSSAAIAAPRQEQTVAMVAEAASTPQPTNYKDVVALFSENREGALYAFLFNHAQPVRCEPGILEIHLDASAPQNFMSRVSQCLTNWTGQRWMVSTSEKAGAPSLADAQKNEEKSRKDKADNHLLVKAVQETFPGAKIIALIKKEIIVPSQPETDTDTVSDVSEFGDLSEDF